MKVVPNGHGCSPFSESVNVAPYDWFLLIQSIPSIDLIQLMIQIDLFDSNPINSNPIDVYDSISSILSDRWSNPNPIGDLIRILLVIQFGSYVKLVCQTNISWQSNHVRSPYLIDPILRIRSEWFHPNNPISESHPTNVSIQLVLASDRRSMLPSHAKDSQFHLINPIIDQFLNPIDHSISLIPSDRWFNPSPIDDSIWVLSVIQSESSLIDSRDAML